MYIAYKLKRSLKLFKNENESSVSLSWFYTIRSCILICTGLCVPFSYTIKLKLGIR